MRIRRPVGALVAVVMFTGVLAGQGGAPTVVAPTVTPMPWEPARTPLSAEALVAATAQPEEVKARMLVSVAALLERQGPVPPRILPPSSPLAGLDDCTLPDRTTRAINARVTFNGWSYLCVEVLDSQLTRRGAGWIRVAD